MCRDDACKSKGTNRDVMIAIASITPNLSHHYNYYMLQGQNEMLTQNELANVQLQWTSPKAKLSTVDCLEADRLEFYYRIAAKVQKKCVSKLWKLS